MSELRQRPTTENPADLKRYWEERGMPWRTEPEIPEERQRELAARRAITPDFEQGIYPFKEIKLTRADVEWLLATHEDNAGHRGPVEWQGEHRWRFDGPDLRGALLSGEDLSKLPLTRVLGSLRSTEWVDAKPDQREMAAVHLERCTLWQTNLQGANLRSAHLEGASLADAYMQGARLHGAHLEGASFPYTNLEGARLDGANFGGKVIGRKELKQLRMRMPDYPSVVPPADLQFIFFDSATHLDEIQMGDHRLGWASLANVRWGDANITVVDWSKVKMVGDEREAQRSRDPHGKPKERNTRRSEHQNAARTYRQLATLLREQGVTEDGDRFAHRAQMLERQVNLRRGRPLRYLGSLFLDLVAGYGYKPLRSVLTYLLVVAGFAVAYFALGAPGGHPLTWNEALVVSLTAFHGRGFFATAFQPGDPQAAVAASEAVIGLLIEITFIATFTQRFFAR
jgi:uncharacterized protein YjbI with pentapeptide repeats